MGFRRLGNKRQPNLQFQKPCSIGINSILNCCIYLLPPGEQERGWLLGQAVLYDRSIKWKLLIITGIWLILVLLVRVNWVFAWDGWVNAIALKPTTVQLAAKQMVLNNCCGNSKRENISLSPIYADWKLTNSAYLGRISLFKPLFWKAESLV